MAHFRHPLAPQQPKSDAPVLSAAKAGPRLVPGGSAPVASSGTTRPRDGPSPGGSESEAKQLIARAAEQLRQERATFEQAKRNEARWFLLRLIMGYAAVLLLAAIMIVASYVLFNAAGFPVSVLSAAGAALFVDVLGLLIAVWKIALNPHFYARLEPVTRVLPADSHGADERRDG